MNDALRAGIENSRIVDAAQSYRVQPVSLGEVTGPYDLDKALQLADQLEDEGLVRKLLMSCLLDTNISFPFLST